MTRGAHRAAETRVEWVGLSEEAVADSARGGVGGFLGSIPTESARGRMD
jgi:hypothetical protein